MTHTAAIYGGSTAYTLVYDHHNRLTEVKDNAGTTCLAKFTWDALGRCNL
ncbi:MAG: RHS repeat protein [Planctomycetes bacterium]|nr:RHS repeat protein [Planctomycetota bacterium]